MTLNEQVSLNRQVADRLGWHVEELDRKSNRFITHAPDGRIIDKHGWATEWACYNTDVPNWERDVAEALDLLPDPIKNKLWITVHLTENESLVSIYEVVDKVKVVSQGVDAELPRAAVKAWLAWEVNR